LQTISEAPRLVPWRSRGSLQRVAFGLLAAVAAARFMVVVHGGVELNRGDFYATMPPAYAEWLNPSLWNSEDLVDSWVFQRPVYLYGPTQYLTVAPLVYWLDTYQEIATVLLVVYGALIVLSVVIMRRAVDSFGPVAPGTGLAMAASTFAFLPLLQAYSQREFEVAVFFLKVCAVALVLHRREGLAAALAAYVTWFKFMPVLWFGYFIIRRWVHALVLFAAVSGVIWVSAELFLGLDRFTGLWEVIGKSWTETASLDALCADFGVHYSPFFQLGNNHSAGIRHALCRFQMHWPWLPAAPIYWALLAGMLAAFLIAFWRLERGPSLEPRAEAWRRALEVSMILLVTCGYFYAHYYYFGLLIVVINILLARYLMNRPPVRLAVLAIAYVVLTVFVIPVSVTSGIVGFDVYRTYMQSGLYFVGQIALIALVWFEYSQLARQRRLA
jgi:hypothetical protein